MFWTFVYDLNGNLEKFIDCPNYYDGVFFIGSYYDIELNKNYIITGNCGFCKSFYFEEGKLYNKYIDSNSLCMDLVVTKYIFIYNNHGKRELIEINNIPNIKIWDFHSKEFIKKFQNKKDILGASLWNNEYLLFGCKICDIKIFDLSKKTVINNLFNKDEKNGILDIKTIENPLYGKCLIFLEGKKIKLSKIVET